MSTPRLRCPHCGVIDWSRAPELGETLRFVVEREDTTARDVAQHFGLGIANASNRMRTLSDLEMIVGTRRGNPGGGIHYIYRPTKLGRDEARNRS